jgi:hypothetical protein
MANNKLNSGEDILVKVDQNNLIYIDPNSVVNNGVVEERGVKQENLVMYVNLEADLIPRTTLVDSGNKTTLVSVAKGTLNILKPKTGDYDTSWTEAYNGSDNVITEKDSNGNQIYKGVENKGYDGTAQSFGIDSININIKGANFIPQININFIDVRGKTLFESPENSPYNAFFHMPWPIFYLTVKGYYGKAIRYRLHLVKFNTRYNESNGNFEVSTTFVGSTYAYLNDIPLTGILNAPYMYAIEKETNTSFNEKTGRYEKKVSKSSRGYTMLRSVYDEYIAKGLLPKNFPTKTLREVITVARSLDKILEKEIFNQVVDYKIFAGLKEFEKTVQNFETAVRSWGAVNLEKNTFEINGVTGVTYSYLSGQEKTSTVKLISPDKAGTLEKILIEYPKELLKTQLFAQKYINDTGADFKKETFSFINQIKKVGEYCNGFAPHEGKLIVNLNAILTDIFNIQKSFVAQRDKLESKVEQKINEVIKDPTKGGIGFEPTIRNIIGVILANADVYIRLMKDVHNRAFEVAERRKKIIGNLEDESKDGQIYPWPEIKKQTPSKQKVLAYPGDPELQQKLQSFNRSLWPEIDFLENYHGVATKRLDSLAQKEGNVGNISYIFEENSQEQNFNNISTLLSLTPNVPYSNKSISSLIYEIYERSRYTMAIDTFNNASIKELALIDFSNLEKLLKEDYDIIDILNTIDSKEKMEQYLLSFSPFERYPYVQDQLPTVEYVNQLLAKPFQIEEYTTSKKSGESGNLYKNLNSNLFSYLAEPYRTKIYPFNSEQYLSYIKKPKFEPQEFKFEGILQVNTKEGLISSPINSMFWVKDGYTTDIFARKLDLDTSDGLFSSVNILNTPYFHKQLYNDLHKTSSYGKYAGSAYLLLNSLPFVDLDEMVNFGLSSTRPSSLFKEVSSSHYIPYHLMLKWGSQYHRYKKYLTENVDIISGITSSIDTGAFFTCPGFNVPGEIEIGNETVSDVLDTGVHPFYDALYHQFINDYSHFDINAPSGVNSFTGRTTSNTINFDRVSNGDEFRYWTSFVDNSKLKSTDTHYTLLPSVGANSSSNLDLTTGSDSEKNFNKGQNSFRIVWTDETVYTTYTGKTFPSYDEYHIDVNFGDYLVMDSSIKFKKVNDLIATFSPDILDKFEEYFLDFATERVIEETPYKKFKSVKQDNFQNLLKSIVTVKKKDSDPTNTNLLIKTLREQQLENLKTITKDILSDSNLIKITIGNPKEIDLYTWNGFAESGSVKSFSYNNFDIVQTGDTTNQKDLKLIIGTEPYTGTPTNYYVEFFSTNNVEFTEEYFRIFRPLVYIYAGYRKNGGTNTKGAFQQYLISNILSYNTIFHIGIQNRQDLYLNTIISKLVGLKSETKTIQQTILNGYNDSPMKLEQYNYFKSFNDKWIAGNSIGQRLLLEEFLFLDKANRDIGDKAYFSLEKLIPLEEPENDKQNLYGLIGMLINGTGFDMRGLPAYVNFYGTNLTTKSKLTPSKKVAQNLFGTFLEVDYQESSPKMILQYTGPTSKHLEMADVSKKYNFNDDSFNVGNANKNPLVITIPDIFSNADLSKSNKVVAFEVNFGDQNQSIFKGVSLDQSSIRNTTESFIAQENLGRSESGSGAHQVDIGLFDIYRQASYTCDVTCLGNVMIQPTMYFYLKNIPMFKGSYWITEVSHKINNNNITTSFKGTRIPYASLPDPKDSFMASYRALFDRITKSAVARVKQDSLNITGSTKNEKSISTDQGTFTIDMGGKEQEIKGEQLTKETGVNVFGVRYNGYNGEKYIQKVTYNKNEYFRAIAVGMGGKTYKPEDAIQMNLLSRLKSKTIQGTTMNNNGEYVSYLTWGDINKEKDFYSLRFDLSVASADIIIGTVNKTQGVNITHAGATTHFLNPKTNKKITITPNGSNPITKDNITGPINVGPNIDGYGIALSQSLMTKLGLYDGDVVYFTMT